MTDLVIAQLMQHPVVEIDPYAKVEFVAGLARTLNVHYFPLVRGASLVGLVCACDVDDALPGTRVLEIANRQVLTVARDSTVLDAIGAMLRKGVSSAVVLRGSYVCGLLTREDILRGAPELGALLPEQRCSSCHTVKHLRRNAGDVLLCAACGKLTHAGDQLDLRGGH